MLKFIFGLCLGYIIGFMLSVLFLYMIKRGDDK